MKFLGLIPARGGSKGIPRKNLVDFCGKPLIAWTIQACQESKRLDEFDLSSDDEEIINFFNQSKPTNYKRPNELATDEAGAAEVVLDYINHLEAQGKSCEYIVYLQPTSPLRNSSDIDLAIEKIIETNADSLISVNPMSEHPYECVIAEKDEWSFLEEPSSEKVNRQTYEDKFMFINGAIYIVKTDWFKKNKKFLEKGKSVLFEMPQEKGIDIDTKFDLEIAKAAFTQI